MSRLQFAIDQIVSHANTPSGYLTKPRGGLVSATTGRRQPHRLAGRPPGVGRIPPGSLGHSRDAAP